MQNSKLKSGLKKVGSLLEHGTDGVIEGKHNFDNYNLSVETLANERKNTCVKCPFFIEEPIEFLRVQDNRIIELSDKMCDQCGCTLSYKLRQSINKCEKWGK